MNRRSEEIEEIPTHSVFEAITKETRANKSITILTLPSAFKKETISPVYPNNLCVSIVPRGFENVTKLSSLSELFNLPIIEAQYTFDPQLSAIRELIK